MDRHEVAAAFLEIARYLAAEGEPAHRVRAYRKGAEAIEAAEAYDELVAAERLTELSGIGDKLAAIATELSTTGRSGLLEHLRKRTPAGVIDMALVPNVGLARARQIHLELGLESIDDLEAAARSGSLATVRGFGPKTVARVLAGIERHRTESRRILLIEAREHAANLCRFLGSDGRRVEIGGAVRRWCETVDSLDLVIEGTDFEVVFARAASHPAVAQRGDLLFVSGLPLRLHVTPRRRFGLALIEATGSADHLAALRRRGRLIEAEEEEPIHRALGLPWLPPEVREGVGELEAVDGGELVPGELVTKTDVRGMVHCHTIHSDGVDDVLAMARSAEAMGMEYVTITDHSPTAHYAGGISKAELAAQWRDIEEAAGRVAIDILRGTESDILPDGGLDYDDSTLAALDVVIASIHSRNGMDAQAMTARLVAMVRQPVFKIWGHALGRLLLRRDPIDCDIEAIIEAAAQSRVAIEVNGDPRRLDLPPEHVRAARRRGIPFVLSTDAHSVRGMRVLPYAVAMARRGWLTPGEVLNTRPADAFRRAVRPYE